MNDGRTSARRGMSSVNRSRARNQQIKNRHPPGKNVYSVSATDRLFSMLPMSKSVRIDAHQHFWSYAASDYAWIDENMRVLRRDFLPKDLAPALKAARI